MGAEKQRRKEYASLVRRDPDPGKAVIGGHLWRFSAVVVEMGVRERKGSASRRRGRAALRTQVSGCGDEGSVTGDG